MYFNYNCRVLKSQSSEKPRQSFIADAGSLESSGSFVSPRGSVGSEELLQGVSHGKAAQVRVGSDEMVVVNVDDDGMIEKKAKTGETSAIKSIIENRFLEKVPDNFSVLSDSCLMLICVYDSN